MEKKQKIIFREKAKRSIADIALHIHHCGYPETAERFTERLIGFGYSLSVFPNKYPICKHKKFAEQKFRCAVFERGYIFVYKVVRKRLIVYVVIHGSLLH